MGDLQAVLTAAWSLFTMDFVIYGHTFTFLGIMVFLIIAGGIFWLLREVIS